MRRSARPAPRHAAFLGVLGESGDDMGRRGEAPLRVRLEAALLRVEIEAEAVRVPLALRQRVAADEGEGEPRRAFETRVRRGHQRRERRRPGVDRERAESAHGVDQEMAAMPGGDLGDRLDRIEDAGRRLAVDDRDMADRRIVGETAVERGRIDRLILGPVDRGDGAADHGRDRPHARPVGAVDKLEEFSVARNERPDRGFDGEGAGPLHRDAMPVVRVPPERGVGVSPCKRVYTCTAFRPACGPAVRPSH